MKAMLFAAGLGSRLGKMTETKPKPLIEAGGKPIIEHVIHRLKDAGVRSIMINLFHLSDQIVSFIESKKSFGLQIEFSREETLLGTGGGLKKAQSFFKDCDNFFIYNCDVYSDLDLRLLRAAHIDSKATVTLATIDRPTKRYLIFSPEGRLLGTHQDNHLTGAKLGFSGIHMATPGIFKYMQDESGNFSIITSYLKAARAGELVMSFDMTGFYWIDAGKPETLEELRKKLGT